MAYEKNTWNAGDVITSEKLTHMEDGIANVDGTPMMSITHADLLALRNTGTLTPGMQYRITDYVCTTTQNESRAVSHPFDIIVTADSANTLNENARACLHEGDTYYTAENHSASLEVWELKYCIDNDRNRFAWADATNGKGVIFWMKDERNNECPYDFKQIQFKRYKITECTVQSLVGKFTALEYADAITGVDEANPIWAYTFSFYDSEAETPTYEDGSIAVMDTSAGCSVYGNVIKCYRNYADITEYTGPFIHYLNNIVFNNNCHSNTFGNDCQSNTFGNDCSSNTFGDYCQNNTFGDYCYNNTFNNSCQSHTFGDYCYNNTFGDNCQRNTLGDNCQSNTFWDFSENNAFGDYCYYNTFGDNCYNNTFGNYCCSNTFNSSCQNNIFGNYCQSNTFGDDCDYMDISAGTNLALKQYFNVLSGTKGTEASHITIPGTGGNNFVTYVGKNTSGVLKTWVPADAVQ